MTCSGTHDNRDHVRVVHVFEDALELRASSSSPIFERIGRGPPSCLVLDRMGDRDNQPGYLLNGRVGRPRRPIIDLPPRPGNGSM